MIKIMCATKDGVLLQDVVPFQGNLKKREQSDLDGLKESLTREGLLMPFAIWKKDGKNFLLDGHGRLEVLLNMAVEDPEILTSAFPCIYITADTEDDARKALLQITSSYGKITKNGVKQFMISIPNYVAPSVQRFVAKPVKKQEIKVSDKAKIADKIVIKLRVSKDRKDNLIEVLKQFDFIEVL